MHADKSQGQSAVTIDKERRIASALSIGMIIGSNSFAGRGFKFWHFDANAGSGWNHDVRVPGSPMVFWSVARERLLGMEPVPFFCDINEGAMRALSGVLPREAKARSVLLPGDNEEGLEVFAEYIRRSGEKPRYAIGSVIIDPNGYFYRNKDGIGAPVNALQWFCREFPRIDIILNLNIRTYQLQRGAGQAVKLPADVLDSLNKSHWLVARAGRARSRFLLAIGRNVKTSAHHTLNIYDRESSIGRYILNAAGSDRQWEFEYNELDISRLSRIPGPSGIQSRQGGGDEKSQSILLVRSYGNRSPPSPLSPVGDVRRSEESSTDLSSLPLFGGGKR